MLLGAAVISGTCAVFFHPAEISALRRIVPTDRLPQAFAQNEARDHAATIAGPSLGGLLYGLGQVVPFVGQLLAYFLSFLAILMIRTPMDVRRGKDGGKSAGACSRTSSRVFDGPGTSGCCA